MTPRKWATTVGDSPSATNCTARRRLLPKFGCGSFGSHTSIIRTPQRIVSLEMPDAVANRIPPIGNTHSRAVSLIEYMVLTTGIVVFLP